MLKIVLIGSGNVGYHLGKRLFACGVSVVQVLSRRLENAVELAEQIHAQAIHEWALVDKNADLYILAISDAGIAAAADRLKAQLPEQACVVHTSGSTPSHVLSMFRRFGVFYPLQTFSKKRNIDFSIIPICIMANSGEDEKALAELGALISEKVYRINDSQRAVLHIAAVFANNFANHCFHISYDILHKEQLPFDLLRPLIMETSQKVAGQLPAAMQTGPAIRGDEETIQRHLDYLEQTNSPYREIYRQLTNSIRHLQQTD